jgi:hypothetical protein
MPVNIHGKQYLTVAERVATFRDDHPDWGIHTDIVSNADVVVIKAMVINPEGFVLGTGYAEEVRGSSNINKTSALENCETSAIGRALASVGYGGEQYASANEVSDAILQQKIDEHMARYKSLGIAVQNHWDSISFIKENLVAGNFDAAAEAYAEIPENDRMALGMARTKGGIWTKQEVDILKSDEWSAARSAIYQK